MSFLHTNGTTSADMDADIDALYSWFPPQAPAQPCPEALFSLTLKGTIGGHEALLTARGQTAAEFKRNIEAINGLLDPVHGDSHKPPQASSQGQEGWCAVHGLQMKITTKHGQSWYSHKTPGGQWCKGR